MKAILVGNGTMGGRHRGRFEVCGVSFVGVADNDAAEKALEDAGFHLITDADVCKL